jgi:hypothetical protein
MVAPLLLRALGVSASCWLAACGSTAPPLVEHTPRPPTLSVAYDYEPELSILVRLDGRPAEGPVTLVGEFPEWAETRPENPSPTLAFSDHPITLTAQGGKLVLSAEASHELARYPRHWIRVGNLEAPLPRLGTHDPFACADALIEAAQETLCQSLPLAAEAPSSCDSRGAEAWRTLASPHNDALELALAHHGAFDPCQAPLTPAYVDHLAALKDPHTRARICQNLAGQRTHQIPDQLGGKIYPICLTATPPEVATRWRRAWRQQTLPEAFLEARDGSNERMLAFYRDYSITEDPRVEQIRDLAARKFGPVNVERYHALQASLEKLTSPRGHRAELCELGATHATYHVTLPRPARGSVDANKDPSLASFLGKIHALLTARTPGLNVYRKPACEPERYWFLARSSAGGP